MEADPDELLAWLKGDGGGERDLQISALEQLCKLGYFKFFFIYCEIIFVKVQ